MLTCVPDLVRPREEFRMRKLIQQRGMTRFESKHSLCAAEKPLIAAAFRTRTCFPGLSPSTRYPHCVGAVVRRRQRKISVLGYVGPGQHSNATSETTVPELDHAAKCPDVEWETCSTDHATIPSREREKKFAWAKKAPCVAPKSCWSRRHAYRLR